MYGLGSGSESIKGLFYRKRHDQVQVKIQLGNITSRSHGTPWRAVGYSHFSNGEIFDPGGQIHPSRPTGFRALVRVHDTRNSMSKWTLYKEDTEPFDEGNASVHLVAYDLDDTLLGNIQLTYEGDDGSGNESFDSADFPSGSDPLDLTEHEEYYFEIWEAVGGPAFPLLSGDDIIESVADGESLNKVRGDLHEEVVAARSEIAEWARIDPGDDSPVTAPASSVGTFLPTDISDIADGDSQEFELVSTVSKNGQVITTVGGGWKVREAAGGGDDSTDTSTLTSWKDSNNKENWQVSSFPALTNDFVDRTFRALTGLILQPGHTLKLSYSQSSESGSFIASHISDHFIATDDLLALTDSVTSDVAQNAEEIALLTGNLVENVRYRAYHTGLLWIILAKQADNTLLYAGYTGTTSQVRGVAVSLVQLLPLAGGGGGGGGSGLSQAQVDARISTLVENFAEVNESTVIPNTRINTATIATAIGSLLPTVTATIARAGTENARKIWSALRVRQAIDAVVPAVFRSGNTDQIPLNKLGNAPGINVPGLTGQVLLGGSDEVPLYRPSATTLYKATLTTIQNFVASRQKIYDEVKNILQEGSNVTLTDADGARTITVASSGSGGGGGDDAFDWATEGNTDTIPDGKIATTIARHVQIPTNADIHVQARTQIEDWAETDNVDPIPAAKLVNAPAGSGGGSGTPSDPVILLDARAIPTGSGATQVTLAGGSLTDAQVLSFKLVGSSGSRAYATALAADIRALTVQAAIPTTATTNSLALRLQGLNQATINNFQTNVLRVWYVDDDTLYVAQGRGTAHSITITALPAGGEGMGGGSGDDAYAWAEEGNTDQIPADKLTLAPGSGTTLNANELTQVDQRIAPFAQASSVIDIPFGRIGTVKDRRDDSSLSFWTGSQAQYDAITNPSSSVIYFIE